MGSFLVLLFALWFGLISGYPGGDVSCPLAFLIRSNAEIDCNSSHANEPKVLKLLDDGYSGPLR